MELYLMRHGIAVDVGENGVTTDADRMLSDEGIKRTTQVARALAALECRPVRIVSSPLARAVQTARLVARHAKPRVEVEELDLLKPGAAAIPVTAWLGKQTEPSLMLVGHMPDLGILACHLLVRAGEFVEFKKTGVACISFAKQATVGSGCLQWLMQPAQLRAVARGRTR